MPQLICFGKNPGPCHERVGALPRIDGDSDTIRLLETPIFNRVWGNNRQYPNQKADDRLRGHVDSAECSLPGTKDLLIESEWGWFSIVTTVRTGNRGREFQLGRSVVRRFRAQDDFQSPIFFLYL